MSINNVVTVLWLIFNDYPCYKSDWDVGGNHGSTHCYSSIRDKVIYACQTYKTSLIKPNLIYFFLSELLWNLKRS